MKRVPCLDGPNHNNLREMEPYRECDGYTEISPEWWQSLAPVSRKVLEERCKKIVIRDIPVPHEVYPKGDAHAYLGYVDSFDVHHWCESVEGFHLTRIPERVKRHLVTATTMGTDPHPEVLEWVPDLPYEKCFVRLSSTSGKNERPVRPVHTREDVVKYLCGNMTLVRRELAVKDKESYLVFRKWVDFERKHEFRAFFVEGKVRAVSQQHTKEFYHYTMEELDELTEAMVGMTFDVPYENWTADVYWDVEAKAFRLIECNPFGSFSGAGSSLFDWRDFPDSPDSPVFKFLSHTRYLAS